MPFNNNLDELRNALMTSDTWLNIFSDATSDPLDHVFLYRLNADILQDGLPVCLLNLGPGWSRDVASFGGYFTTTSEIIIHFEMKYDDSIYSEPEALEYFSDLVGEIMLDLEKSPACHLIMNYTPESTNTPSISDLSEEDSYISFRISVKGV